MLFTAVSGQNVIPDQCRFHCARFPIHKKSSKKRKKKTHSSNQCIRKRKKTTKQTCAVYVLLTTTHNKNRDDVHLKTILVLASNKQAQLLCGVSRVVPKDQLLLATKTSALGYVTTVSVHSALRLTGSLTDFEH